MPHSEHPDKFYTEFELGEIVTLRKPIPGDGVGMQNLRYRKLKEVLKAKTLADVFQPKKKRS